MDQAHFDRLFVGHMNRGFELVSARIRKTPAGSGKSVGSPNPLTPLHVANDGKPRKVHEAIALVSPNSGRSQAASEILAAIEARNLYPFLTEDKLGWSDVNCAGIASASSSERQFHKRYQQDANGGFAS